MTPPVSPALPDAAPSLDEAIAARAVRRVQTLAELAEIGMDIARALRRRAVDEAVSETDAAQPADERLGLAFSRVARAVRLTLVLEDKLDRPRPVEPLNPEAERAAWIAGLAASPGIAALSVAIHRDEVRAKVEQAIAAETEAPEAAERLLAELEERLDEAEAGEDFIDRPIGELVTCVCRDLGLTPDWSLWADEDWAIDEAKTRPPGSPYAKRQRGRPRFGTDWAEDAPWRRDEAGALPP